MHFCFYLINTTEPVVYLLYILHWHVQALSLNIVYLLSQIITELYCVVYNGSKMKIFEEICHSIAFIQFGRGEVLFLLSMDHANISLVLEQQKASEISF